MKVLKGPALKAAAMVLLVPLITAASGWVADQATRLPYAPHLDRTTLGAVFLTGAVAGGAAAFRALHHVLGERAQATNHARILLSNGVEDDRALTQAHDEIDRLQAQLAHARGEGPWSAEERDAAREAIGLPALEASVAALAERIDSLEPPPVALSARRRSSAKKVTRT